MLFRGSHRDASPCVRGLLGVSDDTRCTVDESPRESGEKWRDCLEEREGEASGEVLGEDSELGSALVTATVLLGERGDYA